MSFSNKIVRLAALAQVNSLRRTMGLPRLRRFPKGFVQSPFSCPVAEALNDHLSGTNRLYSVNARTITNYDAHLSMATPRAIAAFIRRFDHGEYPDLTKPRRFDLGSPWIDLSPWIS